MTCYYPKCSNEDVLLWLGFPLCDKHWGWVCEHTKEEVFAKLGVKGSRIKDHPDEVRGKTQFAAMIDDMSFEENKKEPEVPIEQTATPEKPQENIEKKKRGRPKKEKTEVSVEQTESKEPVESTPVEHRKRGRPKKIILTEAQTSLSFPEPKQTEESKQPEETKKRGRPKLDETDDEFKKMKELKEKGMSIKKISEVLNMPYQKVYYRLKN